MTGFVCVLWLNSCTLSSTFVFGILYHFLTFILKASIIIEEIDVLMYDVLMSEIHIYEIKILL